MMRGVSSPRRESDLMDMQALVDSIPALIHTGRPDGYPDYFNKRWLEYLGVTLDKVTGWNWTAVVHPEDVEGIAGLLYLVDGVTGFFGIIRVPSRLVVSGNAAATGNNILASERLFRLGHKTSPLPVPRS
jgi:PAS domain-containing protein